MKIPIKEEILKRIGQIAEDSGIEALIVGGYVRDFFLKRPRNDMDITVVGDPIEFAEKLGKEFGVKVVLFKRFRTARLDYDGFEIEIVGTRKETYLPGSRNPITEEGTLVDDIRRRDFTINSMAAFLNPSKLGEVFDMFNGIKDLQLKNIKTPLDPDITFKDDPLRMLRAVRFEAQIDGEIEKETKTSIKRNSELIQTISQERITTELFKILKSKKPGLGILQLQELGLLRFIFPKLSAMDFQKVEKRGRKIYHHKNNFLHTCKVMTNLSKLTTDTWLMFVAMVHDIAKPKTQKFIEGIGWTFHGHELLGARMVKQIFKDFRLPNDKLKYVETLVELHGRPKQLGENATDSGIRRLAADAGELLEDLIMFCKADITTNNEERRIKNTEHYDELFNRTLAVQESDDLRNFDSPVKGKDIMDFLGIEPGPTIGIIKERIKTDILDGKIPNDFDSAFKHLEQNHMKWIS